MLWTAYNEFSNTTIASLYWNLEGYIWLSQCFGDTTISEYYLIFIFDSLFLISYLKLQNIFISPARWQVYDVHVFMLTSTGIEYWRGGMGGIGEMSEIILFH